MKLFELLDPEAFIHEEWKEEIANEDVYFRSLLKISSETEFKKGLPLLTRWFSYFNEALPEDNSELQSQLIKQWNHAAKLFLCAWFVAFLAEENKAFRDFLGKKDDFNTSEFISFLKTLKEDFNKFKANSDFDSFNDIEIGEDELILLCCIFCSKNLSSESREIPFATAGNDKGQIHLLELRRVIGGGKALKNPTQFPNVDNYADEINDDFGKAIQRALTSNLDNKKWNEEKDTLKARIDELKGSDKKTYVEEVELKESEKELKFRDDLGIISKWGIIWDVKPFLSSSKLEEIAIYEKQIEKDQKENLKIDEIKKPQIPKPLHNLEGKSVGLAALIGIYLTLRNKYPDNRLIYSAQLKENDNQPIEEIEKVEGISDKISAAINTNFIDTFVMHQDNYNHFNKDSYKKNEGDNTLLDLIQGTKLRQIKTIDSEGNFVKTYPIIKKTPENSKTL